MALATNVASIYCQVYVLLWRVLFYHATQSKGKPERLGFSTIVTGASLFLEGDYRHKSRRGRYVPSAGMAILFVYQSKCNSMKVQEQEQEQDKKMVKRLVWLWDMFA